MPNPDFKRLQAIGIEIEQLKADGRWTEKEFRRLFQAAKEAGDGDPRAVLGVVAEATDDSWLEALMN